MYVIVMAEKGKPCNETDLAKIIIKFIWNMSKECTYKMHHVSFQTQAKNPINFLLRTLQELSL